MVWLKRLACILAAVAAIGCGPSSPSWGEFQSRVLDAMDRYKASSGFEDASFLPFVQGEQEWANGIKALACYDPALRAYRGFTGDLVTAYSKIPADKTLNEVPLADLQAARDALASGLDAYDTLSGDMILATTACKP